MARGNRLTDVRGRDDVSDEDAAGDEVQDDQEQEEDPLMNISHSDWRATGRYRRTRILDAAEVEGAKGIDAVLSEPWSKDLTDDVIDDADECPAKQVRNDAARREMDKLIAKIDDAMKLKPGGLAECALSLVREKNDKQPPHVMAEGARAASGPSNNLQGSGGANNAQDNQRASEQAERVRRAYSA